MGISLVDLCFLSLVQISNPLFPGINLSEDQLRDAIHLQVLARHFPEKINFPKTWIPEKQIDRFIWYQLHKSWPVEKLHKKLPVACQWWWNKFAKTVESYG